MRKLRKHQIAEIKTHWHWWGFKPVCTKYLSHFNVCEKIEKNRFRILFSCDKSNLAYNVAREEIENRVFRERGAPYREIRVRFYSS